jgi:hypothetical protein
MPPERSGLVAQMCPRRILGSAAAQHDGEAATICRNAQTEEPAGSSIVSASADEVKPRVMRGPPRFHIRALEVHRLWIAHLPVD